LFNAGEWITGNRFGVNVESNLFSGTTAQPDQQDALPASRAADS
jgi:hypothetical protein